MQYLIAMPNMAVSFVTGLGSNEYSTLDGQGALHSSVVALSGFSAMLQYLTELIIDLRLLCLWCQQLADISASSLLHPAMTASQAALAPSSMLCESIALTLPTSRLDASSKHMVHIKGATGAANS